MPLNHHGGDMMRYRDFEKCFQVKEQGYREEQVLSPDLSRCQSTFFLNNDGNLIIDNVSRP